MVKGKVVLVGCGAVGTSFVYSAVNQGLGQEYVLIDVNQDAAIGNAMDLADCNAVLERPFVNIKAGTYSDCADAELIVITAGRPQKPGETRLDMVIDNAKIMQTIANEIKKSGFHGVTLIASNPVDVLTTVYQKVTGFDCHKVVGSGTTLDSARLRRLIAAKLNISPTSVSAYILGEHGDSSIVPWSCATVFGKPLHDYLESKVLSQADLKNIHTETVQMAYKIIEKKRATFYGIGVALAAITRRILRNESEVMVVGAYLQGEFNHTGFYIGVPAIVNNQGWSSILDLKMNKEEQAGFAKSCETLKAVLDRALAVIK